MNGSPSRLALLLLLSALPVRGDLPPTGTVVTVGNGSCVSVVGADVPFHVIDPSPARYLMTRLRWIGARVQFLQLSWSPAIRAARPGTATAVLGRQHFMTDVMGRLYTGFHNPSHQAGSGIVVEMGLADNGRRIFFVVADDRGWQRRFETTADSVTLLSDGIGSVRLSPYDFMPRLRSRIQAVRPYRVEREPGGDLLAVDGDQNPVARVTVATTGGPGVGAPVFLDPSITGPERATIFHLLVAAALPRSPARFSIALATWDVETMRRADESRIAETAASLWVVGLLRPLGYVTTRASAAQVAAGRSTRLEVEAAEPGPFFPPL